jgi:SNF2 family DNA or RNA helicase
MSGGGGLSLESIIQFDLQAALGGETISRAELSALARLKAPLVKVRGKWVEVDAQEIQAALQLLGKKASGEAKLRDVVKMAVGAGNPAGSIPVDGVVASGWVGDLLAKLENDTKLEALPPPDGLRATLRPYQGHGYSWLRFLTEWGLGACLADDMGLGKTVQALALIQHEYTRNGGKPTLLVCPTSVVGNWRKEAARFTPELPVLVHHGVSRKRGDAFAGEAAKHAIVVSSYSLLQRDIELFKAVSWSGLILDEAQNIKNPETKQAKAARAVASDYRVALTGTPVENNVGDLWSIMEFLNPGFLGTAGDFRKRFFVPIQVYREESAATLLRRVTAPFILRRVKTDKSVIADLPDKLEMKVFCTLTKEQASLYEAVVKDATKAIEAADGIERKGLVLATLSKLKQVCNHPAQFLKDHSSLPGRSGKLARLGEMLEETLEVGDRSLIFTQFAEMGDFMRRHLQENFGVEVLYLYGGTPQKQRERMVERFAQSDGPRIFLLSLKAGGTGLNLTSANHVFHFDRWWNPAVEDQATDRAFRIGQTRNVQVHKFLCAGTLEEKIDEMIERKKDVAGRVVGAGENWLTEMSNAELKSLFALRKEAIGE